MFSIVRHCQHLTFTVSYRRRSSSCWRWTYSRGTRSATGWRTESCRAASRGWSCCCRQRVIRRRATWCTAAAAASTRIPSRRHERDAVARSVQTQRRRTWWLATSVPTSLSTAAAAAAAAEWRVLLSSRTVARRRRRQSYERRTSYDDCRSPRRCRRMRWRGFHLLPRCRTWPKTRDDGRCRSAATAASNSARDSPRLRSTESPTCCVSSARRRRRRSPSRRRRSADDRASPPSSTASSWRRCADGRRTTGSHPEVPECRDRRSRGCRRMTSPSAVEAAAGWSWRWWRRPEHARNSGVSDASQITRSSLFRADEVVCQVRDVEPADVYPGLTCDQATSFVQMGNLKHHVTAPVHSFLHIYWTTLLHAQKYFFLIYKKNCNIFRIIIF